MTSKFRYEIDPHNRLIQEGGGLRRILDGEFKILGHRLVFHVKRPVGSLVPQQIKFAGQWSFGNKNQLVLSLDQWGRQIAGNKLILKTEFLSASNSEMVFTLTSRDEKGRQRISLLQLQGSWQADAQNRLVFELEKGARKRDPLVLRGAWRLNKRQEIEYSFDSKSGSAVALKGQWRMPSAGVLAYTLSGSRSTLVFKASLERAAKNNLVFGLGIGAEPLRKKIVLTGTWRMKAAKLVFETTHVDGRFSSLIFGAQVVSSGDATVSFQLKSAKAEKLGIELTLSKEMFGGEGFLRVQKSGEAFGVFAGFGRSW